MAYNGSGVWNRLYNWTNDAANGIKIRADRMDAEFNDMCNNGLSAVVTRDGQGVPTANIPMGSHKITGLAAATASGDALRYGTGTNDSTLLVPTRQVLTSGTGATYTTPTNCRQIRIRMIAGGGGGGGTSTNVSGGTGGTTSFNSVTVIGGSGGAAGANGGGGGTGGSGSPTGIVRTAGAPGGPGMAANSTIITSNYGGSGGGAGGGTAASAGVANSGGGGSGATISGSGGAASSGGGGGQGETAEFIINTPAATYTYTIGAGGSAGTSAGAGGSGVIIVDEFY